MSHIIAIPESNNKNSACYHQANHRHVFAEPVKALLEWRGLLGHLLDQVGNFP
jgi:hypothetical protein